MDLLTAIKVSASGLSAQRTRLNVLSSNLANANTTQNADGTGPFKRKMPIFKEIEASAFTSQLDKASSKISGVQVTEVVEDKKPGDLVFNPGHPDANEEGYVEMPNVNVVHELTDIMDTSGSYEANAAAIRSAKEMINAALNIGRS